QPSRPDCRPALAGPVTSATVQGSRGSSTPRAADRQVPARPAVQPSAGTRDGAASAAPSRGVPSVRPYHSTITYHSTLPNLRPFRMTVRGGTTVPGNRSVPTTAL